MKNAGRSLWKKTIVFNLQYVNKRLNFISFTKFMHWVIWINPLDFFFWLFGKILQIVCLNFIMEQKAGCKMCFVGLQTYLRVDWHLKVHKVVQNQEFAELFVW